MLFAQNRLDLGPLAFGGIAECHYEWKSDLAFLQVMAHRFSQGPSIPRKIEHVIGDLKGQTQSFSVRAHGIGECRWCSRKVWPQLAGRGDQRSGFVAHHGEVRFAAGVRFSTDVNLEDFTLTEPLSGAGDGA